MPLWRLCPIKVSSALERNGSIGLGSVSPGSALEGNFGEDVPRVLPINVNGSLLAARQPDLVIFPKPGTLERDFLDLSEICLRSVGVCC